jgi:hypothetical protein
MLCVWLALGSVAFGQSALGRASLSGTVQDASGAVISSAHVVATNTATGVARSTVTTAAGEYFVPELIPGTYNVQASASGFKAKQVENIRLEVAQQAKVDFDLEVGTARESVTVTGGTTPILQTQDASVGNVVESKEVTDLPLNGRLFTQLESLTAGSIPATHSYAGSQGGNSSPILSGLQRNLLPGYDVNGQGGQFTFYQLDGIENNEREFGGANIPISVEAIQEFKFETTDFSAEYGRSMAQVTVVTKSGTNQVHGDVFYFLRNDALDAAQWEYTGAHLKNDLKRNQFGGSIGGPIKKDKLFYFASFDGTRQVFANPILETVPTQAMRQGSFPAGDVVFNPILQAGQTTIQPFAGNQVPSTLWTAISQNIVPFMPQPNIAGTSQTTSGGAPLPTTNNYNYVPYLIQRIDQTNVRIDYNRSDRNSFFGRYTISPNLRHGDGPLATNIQGSIIFAESAQLGGSNLSTGWFHNFSPTTINEVRGGFSTDPQQYLKSSNADYASQLGIKQFLFPNAYPGFPNLTIGGVVLGSGEYRPLVVQEHGYEANDTLTLIRRTHNLRLGVDYRRTKLLTYNNQISTGNFLWNGVQTRDRANPNGVTTPCPAPYTGNCNSGNGWADMLLGYDEEAQVGTPIPHIYKYFSNWAGFVNDSWRVKKNLTLSLGLRYEYQTRLHDKPPFYTDPILANNQFTGQVAVAVGSNHQLPAISSTADGLEPAGTVESCPAAGLPENCMISEKDGLQPRVGFAWQATPKTVIRGGAGLFFMTFSGDDDTESCQSWPLIITLSTPNQTTPPSGTAPPPQTITNPFGGAAPAKPTYANCSQDNRKLPRTGQWNFAVERALTPDTVLTVGYVANAGRYLGNNSLGFGSVPYNIPAPYGVVLQPGQAQAVPVPGFSTVNSYADAGTSNYESLQVTLKRRFSQNLSFTGYYTWSKVLTYKMFATDLLNTKVDYGPWADDVHDHFVLSPIWELPFGKGQRVVSSHAAVNKLIGGWETNTIISFNTGFPTTITLSPDIDLLHQNGHQNNGDRPNRTCNPKTGLALGHPTAFQWWNPACFASPAPLEPTTPGSILLPGNAGYDSIRGPSGFSEDLALIKHTGITERYNLEFRAEFFNVWNHPILGLPATTFNPTGSLLPGNQGTITTPNSLPRIIQLALKLHF